MSKTTLLGMAVGDTVMCIDDGNQRALTVGKRYVVSRLRPGQRHVGTIAVTDDNGYIRSFNAMRFVPLTSAETQHPAPAFGSIHAVTVSQKDIHAVLSQYASAILGRPVTVEKVVEKFANAMELVLRQDAAA